jgi:hypothetical protein
MMYMSWEETIADLIEFGQEKWLQEKRKNGDRLLPVPAW